MLYEHLKLPVPPNAQLKSGNLSTAADVLQVGRGEEGPICLESYQSSSQQLCCVGQQRDVGVTHTPSNTHVFSPSASHIFCMRACTVAHNMSGEDTVL